MSQGLRLGFRVLEGFSVSGVSSPVRDPETSLQAIYKP